MRNVLLLILGIILLGGCVQQKSTLKIFYKNRKPSQTTLQKVEVLLQDYQNKYEIEYYDIESENSNEAINALGLPATHFPFAIAIDEKFTAKIDNREIGFVHFPKFMHGIGRHEGNWSIADLQKVLDNNQLLSTENRLPILDKKSETSECEE